jgi:hypothetical protein
VHDALGPNQQICNTVNGEDVFYGVYAYPVSKPGYTTHKVEMKSSLNMYNRVYSPSIYNQGDTPTLNKLQGDGNLVFGIKYTMTGCIALPSRQGGKLTIGKNRDYLVLQIRDTNEDII